MDPKHTLTRVETLTQATEAELDRTVTECIELLEEIEQLEAQMVPTEPSHA